MLKIRICLDHFESLQVESLIESRHILRIGPVPIRGSATERRIQSRPRSRRRALRVLDADGVYDLPRSRADSILRCRVGTRTGCAGTRPFWQCGTTYHVGLDRTHTHTPFTTCEFWWSCITHCLMLQRIRWHRIHRPALSPRRRNPRPTVVRKKKKNLFVTSL